MKHLFILLFSIVFWNLENFFDCVDGGYSSSDREFSARGARHWTRKRYDAKGAMVAKTLLWAEPRPLAVAVAEVENNRVLKSLIYNDILRKYNYSYVHYDSKDSRGIDVALIYDRDSLELVRSYPIPIVDNGDTLRTRDILYVCLRTRSDAELWHLFVNHHPSKYGNSKTSSLRRYAAMNTLARSVDSLLSASQRNIVAMGDFNDVPQAETFSVMEGRLVNMGITYLGGAAEIKGSIRFKGEWQLIDNFIVSDSVAAKSHMEVLAPSFILERDRQFPGDKPRRTYVGPRYNGGVSDHLPVILRYF